jgi:cystathionine beta-synthase
VKENMKNTDSTKKTVNKRQYYYSNLAEAVGNTPLVKLQKLVQDSPATILAKIEFLNPTASVKDRMAVYILDQAVKTGELKPGGTIVEMTSGNTGAAVAMYAAAHGYHLVLTIPDKMSDEKIDTLKAYGAQVHICPTAVAPDDPLSYYETAKRLASEIENSFLMGQYFNLNNIEAHYRSTGPEIWEQTEGMITMLLGGIGTGGTISGTAKYLKERNPKIKVVAVDAVGSVYYDHFKHNKIPEAHPYLVEGIGDDMLCPTTDFSVIDDIIQVSDKDAFLTARRLAREEGILAGGSSGSAIFATLECTRDLTKDDIVVVILPDSGTKYLSKIYSDSWMKQKGFI